MPKPNLWTTQEDNYIIQNLNVKTSNEMGQTLGRSRYAIDNRIARLRSRMSNPTDISENRGFSVKPVPSANRPVEEVLADQMEAYRRKSERWQNKHEGIEIKIQDPGPYAIALFGDAHVDDNGCDLEALVRDMDLVHERKHVYAINLGDLSNNWIRALGHLYGKQNTTDDEAAALIEWLVAYLPWMVCILGNHDMWSPIAERICKHAGVQHVSHGGILKVICGDDVTMIDARHTHRGNSMYNPSHGQLKRNYRGSPCDIIIGGHTHQSAYTMVRNGISGKLGHAIRVGAYKKFDEYADANGFDEDWISPSVMAVIDPKAKSDVEKIHVFHSFEAGIKYLDVLRS